ncbi:MAG: class I SAM-dependent methyltransferase [Methylobacteriaceae bacterium]|nr:class I SAM-dependent methyltransferase [Methylobacteriaceae bacterium]
MASEGRTGRYGEWDEAIHPRPAGAVELAPTVPGAQALEEVEPGSFAAIALRAPPNTLERRAVLALALRALQPGGRLVALGPKDKGGSRLARELAGFGCALAETSRRHHRVVETTRPAVVAGEAEAIAGGATRFLDTLGAWSQPGLFSWDREDPGTRLLAAHLGSLPGRGADLVAGIGLLSRAVLARPEVASLTLVDIDRRAVACARRNCPDPRASFVWADARVSGLTALDFVVMNPPFHGTDGEEERALGQAFLRAAAAMLRKGGVCRLVANRHLPYEATLGESFASATTLAEAEGFKVIEARR